MEGFALWWFSWGVAATSAPMGTYLMNEDGTEFLLNEDGTPLKLEA